jgi:hypothetical protein
MKLSQKTSLYFTLVFGAGFLLGCIRVPFIEPLLGARVSELLEMPVMFVAIVLAARLIVLRSVGLSDSDLLMVGSGAAVLILAADVLVGVLLRGLSLWEVFTARDPVSGAAYYLMVLICAAMPWTCRRWTTGHDPQSDRRNG